MNTTDFLTLILPAQGKKVIAIPAKSGGMQHVYFDSHELAAKAALKLDAAGKNVYFGCSAFATDQNRTAANVESIKCFWADIDAGETKPYATAREAAHAVSAAVNKIGLPSPIMVRSGFGIHAYWPLTEAIDPQSWRRTAVLLKAVFRHAGLEADPSRTSDMASVLRVPGTHHRKSDTPKPVKIVFDGEMTTFEDFRSTLEFYIERNTVETPMESAPKLNSDLTSGMEYPPGNAEIIAKHCGVMELMRDSKGNIDQPTWYGCLGIIGFCEGGDEIAHAWSEGHPKYSAEETEQKLTQARQFKPTTCAKLFDHQPSICQGCPHFGNIKSPIALSSKSEPIIIPAQPGVAPQPAKRLDFPDGFGWNGKEITMSVTTKSEDGGAVREDVPITNALFYPVTRINQGDVDGFAMELELRVRENDYRRFTIQNSLIGKGGAELAGELAKREIVARPKMNVHVQTMLSRWLDKQRQEADEIGTYKTFGWQEGGFLIGEHMYRENASPQKVIMRNPALARAPHFAPKGSLEEWCAIIDRAYNHPGQEALQYLVLASFAAPLFAMFEEFGGVTVYAHSAGSGRGKTTAMAAGMSAWGNHRELALADGAATSNAVSTILGAHHNLPLVLDELTNMDPKVAGQIVFNVSQGKQKERLDAAANLRDNNAHWKTILLASGNNPLSEKLSANRANAEAELARIFEFVVDCKSPITPNEAAELFPKLLHNYGHAGAAYAQFLVNNLNDVRNHLFSSRSQINSVLGIQQNERYWSALHASVLTALNVCQAIGVLNFDESALFKWIAARVKDSRAKTVQFVSDPLEMFGRMLADLSHGVLVTEGLGDVRKNASALVIQDPRGTTVTGRAILQTPRTHSVLLLSVASIRDWCVKRGVSMTELFDAGTKGKWISEKVGRFAMGRGTDKYAAVSARVQVWVVDAAAVWNMADTVVFKEIKLVSGGDDNAEDDDTRGSCFDNIEAILS